MDMEYSYNDCNTGAGTYGYNHSVELHWHLNFHKFDIKSTLKEK